MSLDTGSWRVLLLLLRKTLVYPTHAIISPLTLFKAPSSVLNFQLNRTPKKPNLFAKEWKKKKKNPYRQLPVSNPTIFLFLLLRKTLVYHAHAIIIPLTLFNALSFIINFQLNWAPKKPNLFAKEWKKKKKNRGFRYRKLTILPT